MQKSQIRTKVPKLTTAWILHFKSLKFDVAVTTIWPWVTENQSTDWISNPLSLFVEKKWTAAATRPIWFISTRPDHCAPFRVKLFCDCQKAPLYHNAARWTIFNFLRFLILDSIFKSIVLTEQFEKPQIPNTNKVNSFFVVTNLRNFPTVDWLGCGSVKKRAKLRRQNNVIFFSRAMLPGATG